jgi:receptor protein-tyrosine kinase
MAESFRAVLPSLFFGTHPGDRPRIIVMTSAKPGEGKTTVSSNLAICVAEVTHNVLLLDGDMRRPRLHKIFGVPRQDGLGELLSSDKALDWGTVEKSIRPTQVSGLSLLASGAMSDTIANLLYSRRLPELLLIVRERFEMVIIDAPPVLQVPDARLLGRLVDGVIMVIRAGHTHRQAALQASQLLNDDRTRILGTIVNSSDPKAVYTYGYAS